ncbi:MAG: DUF4388 domain-containing protein [Deltaproteobacteria bacterium]|nr:DUF4388 domain-containing protein [Deltaproteobacteria bacterium]
MALRGTLKDFGIADIFQLIGHQGKTGTLKVHHRDQEVTVLFHTGNVVRAESSTRQKRELLGSMLVRAEVVREEQLTAALETQKKTLKRLGDILVSSGALDHKTLRTFARLQTTETIYRLFLWDGGSYEFAQAEVVVFEDTDPIRSENLLMEGFRQVDEWPVIRRRISGYGIKFEKLEDLDALTASAAAHPAPAAGGGDDLGLDAAFGDLGGGSSGGDPRLKNVGQNERIVYHLITPDRDVQKIIDLSRLGEFETCKALVTLIDAAIVAPLAEVAHKPSADAMVGGIHAPHRSTWALAVTRVAITSALVVAALWGAWALGLSPTAYLQQLRPSQILGYTQVDLQSELARAQLGRIRRALAVYRAEAGAYPETLNQLVTAGLLRRRDLRYPWQQPYYYQRRDATYDLLRPLY